MATSDSTLLSHSITHTRKPSPLREDLTGQRFGRWTVQSMFWENSAGRAICLCDCGTIKTVRAASLKKDDSTSCGCFNSELTAARNKQPRPRKRRRSLTGQRFNMLLVIETYWVDGTRYVKALCDCGKIWEGIAGSIASYQQKSCGHLRIATPEHTAAKRRIYVQRRLARKRGLPSLFDTPHITFLLQYWKFSCAICGRPDGGFFFQLVLDHWIPLADPTCLGTVPWNILPLCGHKKGSKQSGDVSCNGSKSGRDPRVWLTEKLGPRKAKAKLREIDAYFAAARAFEEERQALVLSA